MMTCFLVLLTAALVQNPANAKVVEPSAQSGATTPAQMAGIRAFWHDCLGKDDVEAVSLKGTTTDSFMPPGSLDATVAGEEGGDIVLAEADGAILSYMTKNWTSEPGIMGKTHKDAISIEWAWVSAARVLTHYHLSTCRDDYRIDFDDTSSISVDDDLYGALWVIRRRFTHNGYKCRNASFYMSISAFTGKVVCLRYKPILIPKMEPLFKITETDAVAKAETWLRKIDRFSSGPLVVGGESGRKIEAVIACSWDSVFGKDEKCRIAESPDAFYCWQVPYKYAGEFGCIRVRIDNGDVIGGY